MNVRPMLTWLRRRAAGPATIVAAMFVAAMPASAQVGWTLTPATLSPTVGFLSHVAVDGNGNAVAIWSAPSDSTYQVRTARYLASTGLWTAAEDLTPPDQNCLAAGVGADTAGHAVAVWMRSTNGAFVVETRRYSPVSGWAGPVALTPVTSLAEYPSVSVSAGGDALVTWVRHEAAHFFVDAARFAIATGTWSAPTTLSPAGIDAFTGTVAVNGRGDGVAFWSTLEEVSSRLMAARFSAGSGRWSPPDVVANVDSFADATSVAMDDTGNITAAWRRQGVQAARYDAAAGTWSPALQLATALSDVPQVAAAPDGTALAMWTDGGALRAARLAAGTWTTTVITAVAAAAYPDVAFDGAGTATAIWSRADAAGERWMVGARLVAGVWTPPLTLSTAATYTWYPEVSVAPTGHAAAIWVQIDPLLARVQSARWDAQPNPPTITGTSARPAGVRATFAPPYTDETAYAPLNYDYSVDGGRSWTTRAPASTATPIDITGLAPGVTVTIRIRAINRAGPGVPSDSVISTPAPLAPPTDFAAVDRRGRTVTFTWTPPAEGPAPSGYELEGGVLPGETLAGVGLGPTPVFTAAAPAGVFHLRLRTVWGAFRSAPSNEIRVVIDAPLPPAAPADVLGLAAGSTLALSWTTTADGGDAAQLWAEVSGAAAAVTRIPVAETFTVSGVPAGTYTVRLYAVNASGVSPPSNAVTLTFPGACTGGPDPPRHFVVAAAGATVTAAWTPPAAGPALTHYVLSATGTAAAALPTTARVVTGGVPPGTYTFQVVAVNPCGTSLPAPSQTVTVPEPRNSRGGRPVRE